MVDAALKSIKRLAALLLAGCAQVLYGADPFFKPNDVVALVGGEDMAVMRDHPALELLVIQQPGLSGVKFRNLAQEGDTVFEQFRDLNFPSWEEQLKKTGATVVITRFGRMESLAGEDGLITFIAAYEKLLHFFASDGRRLIVLSPIIIEEGATITHEKVQRAAQVSMYAAAAKTLAVRHQAIFAGLDPGRRRVILSGGPGSRASPDRSFHLQNNVRLASWFATDLGLIPSSLTVDDSPSSPWTLLREKNTLWFHYWRPQNWAFLAGDRTEQPSSRDHRDPSKRWFPAEMETWLPLIAAKERKIQTMIEASRKP